jgi:carbamoyl-phosphate synthase small subunit
MIYLTLENGVVFQGEAFGAPGEVTGEVVFTTGMTGYIETLTDPSYCGQIVLQTFPLIGNYGIIGSDFESAKVLAKGYIVKHPCETPSNFRMEGTLDAFLKEQGVVGLYGIDTRKLTKIIRESGVMNGKITTAPATEADIAEIKAYAVRNPVAAVSCAAGENGRPVVNGVSHLSRGQVAPTNDVVLTGAVNARTVALLCFGAKRGIADALAARGCHVVHFPHDATPDDILGINPHGIMLSNGPGDPADPGNHHIIETIRALQGKGLPIFGICLGHQLLALANGYRTKKLKFGHRGANQPVKDLQTGRVYITSQNHGYAVETKDGGTDHLTFVNVNDDTCEGLDYGASFSVQFHPEARGGPLDTGFLFDRFIERMERSNATQ